MALLRILAAKFFGPSSSAPAGGPRGWRLTRWMATWIGPWFGRPRPRLSYALPSRGEGGRGGDCDCGVAGDDLPDDGSEAEPSSSLSSAVLPAPDPEMAMMGDAAPTVGGENRSGDGRVRGWPVLESGLGEGEPRLDVGREEVSRGGGVILTSGIAGGGERLSTEWLVLERRHDTAESLFDGCCCCCCCCPPPFPPPFPPPSAAPPEMTPVWFA